MLAMAHMQMSSRLRWGGLLLLGLLLVWLPVEDISLGATLALAGLIGLWLFAVLHARAGAAWMDVGWGLLAGALVPILGLTLMAFKSGLHAHGFADFSLAQVASVLGVYPQAIGLGFLLGLLALVFRRWGRGEEAR